VDKKTKGLVALGAVWLGLFFLAMTMKLAVARILLPVVCVVFLVYAIVLTVMLFRQETIKEESKSDEQAHE